MSKEKAKKIISVLMLLAMIAMAGFDTMFVNIYAEESSEHQKPHIGATYELLRAKLIYRDHNKREGIKRRKELSDTAKKFAVKGKRRAKFKKGTRVTCLRIYKDWIRIPSGWMRYEKKDFKLIEL